MVVLASPVLKMRTKKIAATCMLALLWSVFGVSEAADVVQATPEALTVAVAAFAEEGLSGDLAGGGRFLSASLVRTLRRASMVNVVDQLYLERILEEILFQRSPLANPRSAVDVGRLAGARFFVFGSLVRAEESLVATAQVVDIERGQLIARYEATGAASDLLAIADELAFQVASALSLQTELHLSKRKTGPLTLAAEREMERIRQMTQGLPIFGLDPLRWRRQGEYQQAIALCDRFLSEFPGIGRVRYYRALFLLQTGDLDGANREVRVAAESGFRDDGLDLLRAYILFAASDLSSAERQLLEITARSPYDAQAFFALAQIYQRGEHDGQALAALLRASQGQPSIREVESNIRALLGGMDLEKGRPNGLPDDLYPAAIGYQAFYQADRAKADRMAERVIRSMPRLYLGHYLLGMYLFRNGRLDLAISRLRTALSLRPESPDIHRALAQSLASRGSCETADRHRQMYLLTVDSFSDVQAAALQHDIKQCHARRNSP